ncbi:MAG TPA: hypothetical protein VH599_06510 [Ktedonobacterales bacterium]|jgi:hypothetical protein
MSAPPAPAAGGAVPGAELGLPPSPPRKRHRKVIALVLAALVVLGAGGTAAFILTRPRPIITITGPQQSGSLPAGAPDTAFSVTGRDFTANSAITFLLDGNPAPGAPATRSDQTGSISVELPITDDWLLGRHTLTAKDAQGYLTKDGALLAVLAAPVLSVRSSYMRGSLPAGSNGTTLAFSGMRFALHALVTLQLDGKLLDTSSPVMSDGRGRIAGALSVDAKWALGTHSLTAQDAQGNVTQAAASLVIVDQGEAGTPGPKGAPADDISFGGYAHVSARDASGVSFSFTQLFMVTGRPDPAGGSVCALEDNGKPQTFTGTLDNSSETFTETITFTCRGTYKHGHLTYIEIGTSDKFVLGSGVRCASSGPYIYGAYDGTFSSPTTMSGVYAREYFQANCTDGTYIFRDSATGKWTGGT